MKISNKVKVFAILIVTIILVRPLFTQEKLLAQQSKKSFVEFPYGSCEQKKNEVCEMPRAPSDETVASVALGLCFSGKVPEYAFQNAMTLLSVEKKMDIPLSLKGMTLAAACRESKFDSSAEGDHRFSRDKKTPMAIGILQMWPVYERAYGVDRKSVSSSAEGWLKHIKLQVKPTAKLCKTKSVEENWRIAWVTGVRAPKSGGRCKERAKHWSFFKKMQKRLELINQEHKNEFQPQV